MELASIAIWGVVVFSLLGVFFGFALAATARRFHVPVNPVVDQIREVLPAANCGACGFAGCAAYAEAVAERGETSPSLCVPGGQSTAERVAQLSGKGAAVVEERVAVLRCHGTTAYVREQAEYRGIRSCAAASLVFGGPRACKNGCLGLGDCVRTCPFDAMHIDPMYGIVAIDHAQCTGCGLCVPACPKKILDLYPRAHRVELACVAREKAGAVRAKCLVGCTTCQKCVGACPAQAIAWDGTTIQVDHAACVAYGLSCKEACVEICPTFVLHRTGGVPLPEELAHPLLLEGLTSPPPAAKPGQGPALLGREAESKTVRSVMEPPPQRRGAAGSWGPGH
ncbi:MAG: Fe-S cluster domain-containing protein [Deltaproteobacteria bacterium]|nr:Fe-S cluster domain-containing protein [Deltaproteobacteria bacterium]